MGGQVPRGSISPKKNNTSFSYNVDGRWNCFLCGASGRGAIDFVKAIRKIGFQEAVSAFAEIPKTSATPSESEARPSSPGSDGSEASENPIFRRLIAREVLQAAPLA